MTTIIAKNIAGIDLLIDDMGIFLASGTSRILTDNFDKIDIGQSKDLYNFVNTDKIIINNGLIDLSKLESLEMINFQTELEDLNNVNVIGSGDNTQFIFDSDGSNTARTRVTGSSYVVIARYIFKGAYNGIIPYFKMVAATKVSTGTCYIQLFDVTHNVQIFEKSILGLNAAIYTVSNTSGITTTESIFEIRGRATSSNELYIYSFLTQFA